MRRSVIVIVLVGLGLIGCSEDPGSVDDLAVGDCVVGDVIAKGDDVETVDCDESHVVQVIGRVDLDDGDFPGAEAITATGFTQCTGEVFTGFVGIPFIESATIYASAVTPDEAAWDDGDRTVVCLAHTEDHTPTTGSFEGAGTAE